MRGIKFRAWNELAEGGEMVTEENSGLSSAQILDRFGIVMQYTGLKDMDKVEIYEGDIIRVSNYAYVVQWDIEEFRWMRKVTARYGPDGNWHTKGPSAPDHFSLYPLYSFERRYVIGNIHDNPQLLNQ